MRDYAQQKQGMLARSPIGMTKQNTPCPCASINQPTLLQLQRRYGNHYVQRLIAQAQQEEAATEASAAVEQRIHQARGGGQALDRGVRVQMESAFGADFSGVRIHTGETADTLNRDLSARAFTTGQDIFFRQDEYSPGSADGRELLAHELTHVVQQTGAGMYTKRVQTQLTLSQPGDEFEQEADLVAKQILATEARPNLNEVAMQQDDTAVATVAMPSSLIARNVMHNIQSRRKIKSIQRLIRTPYPWQGVITPAIGANLRSAPNASDPTTIVDSIPRGQTVTVISATGNWLQVTSRYRGPEVTGYIHHTLVDDAASAAMAGTVGTTMVWRPSGPGSGTDFEAWASASTETPFPAVTGTTVMNCWEAVLLSAYRAGSINWSWIHHLYTSVPVANWVAAMSRGALHSYAVPGPNLHMPQRGDLVFFDGIAHVALATGNGSDVYTFWPPPNTPFTPGGTTDRVKVFTIEQLVNWWGVHMPPQPVVEFGAPHW